MPPPPPKTAPIRTAGRVDIAHTATAFLGEGAIWSSDEQLLYWVDILEPAIHWFDPASGTDQRLALSSMVSAVGLCGERKLVAALQNSLALVDLRTGTMTELASPSGEPPRNRFNDGRVDSAGNFWVGSMSMVKERGVGSLFRLSPDGSLTRVLSGVGVGNGIGWSPDDRVMYFTDTQLGTIFAFDHDAATGEIANRRTFATVAAERGAPDGLAVDAEGRVWSAHWDGWCITCYAPDGTVEEVVSVPVPRPTSCAFGGPDRRTLFVTSARVNMSADQLAEAPLSGSLLAIACDVAGLPEARFGTGSPHR